MSLFELSDPPRKPRAEAIVPMINVVFLLLIFFLMTSTLSQPSPFEVTPPQALSEIEAEGTATLFISETGRLFYDGINGADAISALAGTYAREPVQVRVDADLEASKLAKILGDLSAAGLTRIELVVAPR